MKKIPRKTLKILKIINSLGLDESKNSSSESNGRGRKQTYTEMTLFKIFVVMKLLNIDTIQGVWRFLAENKRFAKECGLESVLDRSTLSRRLSDRIQLWFE